MSSGFKREIFRPTSFVFDHSIKNRESFVEVPNDGVKTGGNQSGYVQSATYRSSSTPDGATAFESSAVTPEGSQAGQSRDFFAAEGAELGEFRQQSTAGDRLP